MTNPTIDSTNSSNSRPSESSNRANAMLSEPQIPTRFIALIALFQGIALAFLYQSLEQKMWPGTDLTWLTALITFFISLPSLFLLIASKQDYKLIIKGLLPFTLLISVLGAYIGHEYSAYPSIESTFFVFSFAILIACFKAVMYIKLMANKQAISYESLFLASWRNAVIFALTVLFTSIFFGILHLGAALFDLLGIAFFTELLDEEWFTIPAFSLATAFAIHIFRKISHLTDNISTILQTLMKFLLPLLVLVSLGFLFTLPFTGLEKLWETSSGSFLLLWLMALSLFFVNAIYHKGNDNKPYHIALHRFILVGIAVLPVFSLISAYGIFVRIAQYGFTPERLWGLSIWFILSCFAIAYLVGIVKLRDHWLIIQSKTNVVMGLVVLAFTLLVNSPVLNFKSISASSQMARYYQGEVSLEDFNINYFSSNLGKPGYDALQTLKAEIESSEPEFAARIETAYKYVQQRAARRNGISEEFEEPALIVTYWPNQQAFNSDLIAYIDKQESYNRSKLAEYRISIDLNHDGVPELITIIDRSGYFNGTLWTKKEEGWGKKYININIPENKDLAYTFNNFEMKLVNPEYKIIDLDGITIDVN